MAGSGKTSWMASHPPTHTCGAHPLIVGPRRLLSVSPVDEAEAERASANRRRRWQSRRRRPPPTTRARRRRSRASPVGQGVDPAVDGIDEIGLVVVPPLLVLLGAVVMVDAEHDRAGGPRRRAQVERRLPAPGADLHQRRRRSLRPVMVGGWGVPARAQRRTGQGQTLVLGHEPACRPGLSDHLVDHGVAHDPIR